MRAELPWNIAGIPPEAREAARAAARREGLSVGEWLTRRILRSFSGMEDEPGPAFDAWGLPPSAASRRDTEDMLARVSRSESESSDVYRRIEDQLRTVGRRLDLAERSQSENHRVMSKTAAEIHIATREQAQAFDQMAAHVMTLSDRLERLERAQAQDGVKDAVKALHQGLSRLADQITQTANQSAAQASSLAGNLEQLATRFGQLRAETEAAGKILEQRLDAVEKSAQFSTSALDHALEKLEAQSSTRAADLAEAQKQHSRTEGQLMRLEENLSHLASKTHEPAIDRRLDGIDRSLADLAGRLDRGDIEPLEESVRSLSRRLDSLDKKHNELVAELSANLRPAMPEPAPSEPQEELGAEEPDEAPPALFTNPDFENAVMEAPDFAPAAPAAEGGFGQDNYDAGVFPPGLNEADPFAVGFAPDDFAAPPPAASDLDAQDAAPDLKPEDFLTAARRSVQAASMDAGRSRILAAPAEPKPRLRLVLIAGLILGIAVAALVLSEKLKPAAPAPRAPKPAALHTPSRLPAPAQTVKPAPQNIPPPAEQPLRPAAAPPPAPSDGADRVTQLANSGNAIAQTILGLRYLDGQGVPADLPQAGRLLAKAAEQGQPVAQYRLGTMYERGQGIPADGTKAAKWYLAAANQGNRKAMHNLAVAYAGGTGGKKDMAEAARWFSKAAELGLSDSQFNLAVLYERGDGVPQSLIDAYKWYAIAAGAGDAESKQRLSVLQTQLSDADRAAAQKAAAGFHAAPLSRAANVPPEISDLPQ